MTIRLAKERQNILISIVLPCFNEVRHGYLESILANLHEQEGHKEIIFVITPGGDRTEEAIHKAPLSVWDALPRSGLCDHIGAAISAEGGVPTGNAEPDA